MQSELKPEPWELEAAAVFMDHVDDDETGSVHRVAAFLRRVSRIDSAPAGEARRRDVANTINRARYASPLGGLPPRDIEAEDQQSQDYSYRLADAVLALFAAPPAGADTQADAIEALNEYFEKGGKTLAEVKAELAPAAALALLQERYDALDQTLDTVINKADDERDALLKMHASLAEDRKSVIEALAASEQRLASVERERDEARDELYCPIGLDKSPRICSAGTCKVCMANHAQFYIDKANARAEAAEAKVLALQEAVEPFKRYAEMRTKQPLKGLGDSVHLIHGSTEFEAELKFSDILRLVAALEQAKPAVTDGEVGK